MFNLFAFFYMLKKSVESTYIYFQEDIKKSNVLLRKIGKIKKITISNYFKPTTYLKNNELCVKYKIVSERGKFNVCVITGNLDNKATIPVGYVINNTTYYDLPVFDLENYRDKIYKDTGLKIEFEDIAELKSECRKILNLNDRKLESVYYDPKNEKYLYYLSTFENDPNSHKRKILDNYYIIINKDGSILSMW